MIALGDVRWIFLHTAAYDGDAGADRIRRWHLAKGWDDIGYHFVVRRDGTVEKGRSLQYAGAQVEGANTRSIGICCEGHGDHQPFTAAQLEALAGPLLHDLMKTYNVPVEGVLGHREVNRLIEQGYVGDQYRTRKTCPGNRVDMEEIRDRLRAPSVLPEPRVELAPGPKRDIEIRKIDP